MMVPQPCFGSYDSTRSRSRDCGSCKDEPACMDKKPPELDVIRTISDGVYGLAQRKQNSERLYLGYEAYNLLREQLHPRLLDHNGHRASFGGMDIYLVHEDPTHVHVC